MDTLKIIAKAAWNSFGGEPRIFEYWDDAQKNSIDVLSTPNQPCKGISSYSTIGLSEHDIGYVKNFKSIRVEIVGACATEYDSFSNILATCAFCVINSNFNISGGKIFRDTIFMYYPNFSMKHILFISPFLWNESLKAIDLDEKIVTWLLAIPISEQEFLFASQHGVEALEKLFEKEQIDLFNLNRVSIL
jgi:hypothetical protein